MEQCGPKKPAPEIDLTIVNKQEQMQFLLIYESNGDLGGTETLMARMSRWLNKNGHEVSILVERGDKWLQTMPKEAKVVVLGERFRELQYYFHAKRLWNTLGIPKPEVIKTFSPGSAWIACQLAHIFGNNCKVIAGLYGGLLFKWYYAPQSLGRWSQARLHLENYLRCIPANARLMGGTDLLDELTEVHNEQSRLWPLPIDTNIFEPALRKPQWGKIVSVGRLAPAKDYNFYMIDVVKELRARGHAVQWWVYGEGEYETEMRKRIAQEGLESAISIRGVTPYHRFWQVLSDAYVFVGMGTAILEASCFRVPNVYANPYDRVGLTYGPVYRIPKGSVVPALSSPPTIKVVDEIERILLLNADQYQAEEELVCRHVDCHDLDKSMNQFLQFAREAGTIKYRKSLYWNNYLSWLMRRATNQKNGKDVQHPDVSLFFKPASPAGLKVV
jgi:glycosyltransferase involved in cell wall biosynthesis